MLNRFSRTELLLGTENMHKLAQSHVAVFGIGGVGSYVTEGLVRAGLGKITLIDSDEIALTNLNRQIHALDSTLGELKTEAMKRRILDINPQCRVNTISRLYTPEDNELFWTEDYDYVVDAIDDVRGKISLMLETARRNIPLISSMGTANKLNPQNLVVTDIHKTHTCPLAKLMRQAARKNAVKKLKVVYSPEPPITNYEIDFQENTTPENQPASVRKRPLGSSPFVPPVAGLIIASEVVKDLCNIK